MTSHWEVAWCSEQKRYYYQDRNSGKSSWLKPSDCSFELPDDPPEDTKRGPPVCPNKIPPGWQAVLDRNTMKYYYYNEETKERTWFKPAMPEGLDADEAGYATGKQRGRAGRLRKVLWDADTFKHRIQQALDSGTRDDQYLMKVLEEICESNSGLLGKCLSVPMTCSVTYQECMQALLDRTIEDYGMEPKVSFSYRTTAEALRHFALQDKRRVVCGLNFASGIKPGRHYCDGGVGQEEDLCRRIPALYHSLCHAEEEHLYPFGPHTCHSLTNRNKYCDVLFTPNLVLARGHESEGFPILPDDQQAVVSIVSAVAPDLFNKEVATPELLCGTLTSIFAAPVYKEPRCTTLVVGAWGCAAGNKPELIANLFAQALKGELKDVGKQLGKLYHEVHFAIPPRESHGIATSEDVAQTFRQVLGSTKYKIKFVDL